MRYRMVGMDEHAIRYGRIKLPIIINVSDLEETSPGLFWSDSVQVESPVPVSPKSCDEVGYVIEPTDISCFSGMILEEAPMYRLLDESEPIENGDVIVWSDGDEWVVGEDWNDYAGELLTEFQGWISCPNTLPEEDGNWIVSAVLRPIKENMI